MPITQSDFTPSTLTGTVTLAIKTATFTKTVTADQLAEGNEKFVAKLRKDSTSGTVVATSNVVRINDTSQGGETVQISPIALPVVGNKLIRLTSYSQQLTATGGVPGTYIFTYSGTLPPGISMSSSGLLSGTPTTIGGPYNFTVTATDANTDFGVQLYSVNVEGPGIYLTPSTLPNGSQNIDYKTLAGNPLIFSATGGAAPYTFDVTQGFLPDGLTISPNGLLSGRPTAAGSTAFKITATDANGNTGSQTYTLVIVAVPITISPSSLNSAAKRVAYSQQLTASSSKTTTYTYTLSAGTLPTGLALSSSGLISGTTVELGSKTFTVKATDADGSFGTRQYTLSVSDVFIFISLTSGGTSTSLTVANRSPYSDTFQAAGGGGPYTWSYTNGTLPPGLILNTQSGVLSGSPTSVGTYNFSIVATDSAQNSGIKNYTYTISSVGIVLSPSTLPQATVNVAYSQALSATGGTSPYSFTVTTGTLPTGITLSSGGTLSGTCGISIERTFTVTATDANGNTGTQQYTLEVAYQSWNIDLISVNGGIIPDYQVFTNSTNPNNATAINEGEYVMYFTVVAKNATNLDTLYWNLSPAPGQTKIVNAGDFTLPSGSGIVPGVVPYDWGDYATEFNRTGTPLAIAKWIAGNVYVSNSAFTTSSGTRYGILRKPDANGLDYWVSQVISNSWYVSNACTIGFLDAFFASVAATSEASRALTNVKTPITTGGLYFYDRQYAPPYTFDYGFSQEFNMTGADLVLAKWIGNNLYLSNSTFTGVNVNGTTGQTRYGLFRKPDTVGVLYWTLRAKELGYSQNDTRLINLFFTSINLTGGDGETRATSSSKSFLVEGGSTFTDRETWSGISVYGETDFIREFNLPVDRITLAEWITSQLYGSNNAFTTTGGTRYGLNRKSGVVDLNYWVTTATSQGWAAASPALINAFFNAVQGDDLPRSQTNQKEFLEDSLTSGSVFNDRPDQLAGSVVIYDPYTYTNGYQQEFGRTQGETDFATYIGETLYASNTQFTGLTIGGQTNQTRYGLNRKPDLIGLNYWVNYAITNNLVTIDDSGSPTYVLTGRTALLNAFFTAVSSIDPSRSLLADKPFIEGTAPGTKFYDRPDKSGSLNFGAIADQLTEGPEYFILQVRTGSTAGPVVATSDTVAIVDTSTATGNTFGGGGTGLTNYTAIVNEGDTLNFQIWAPGTIPVTTLTTGGNVQLAIVQTKNVDATDFVGNVELVTATAVSGRTWTASITAKADNKTEGFEYFTAAANWGSNLAIVTAPGTVGIRDTSTGSSFKISTQPTSITEGDIGTFTVDAIAPDGTLVYWKINHISTNNSDFVQASTRWEVIYAFANNLTAPVSVGNDTGQFTEDTLSYWMTVGLTSGTGFDSRIAALRSANSGAAAAWDAARALDAVQSNGTGWSATTVGAPVINSRAKVLKAYYDNLEAKLFPDENSIRYWMCHSMGTNNATFNSTVTSANDSDPGGYLAALTERAQYYPRATRPEVLYAYAANTKTELFPVETTIQYWMVHGLAGFNDFVEWYRNQNPSYASSWDAARSADLLGTTGSPILALRSDVVRAYQDNPDATIYPTNAQIRYYMTIGLASFASDIQIYKSGSPVTWASENAARTALATFAGQACTGSAIINNNTANFSIRARKDLLTEGNLRFTVSISKTAGGTAQFTSSEISVIDSSTSLSSTVPFDATGYTYGINYTQSGVIYLASGYGYPLIYNQAAVTGQLALTYAISNGVPAVTLGGSSAPRVSFTVTNSSGDTAYYQVIVEYFARSHMEILHTLSDSNGILASGSMEYHRDTGLSGSGQDIDRNGYWTYELVWTLIVEPGTSTYYVGMSSVNSYSPNYPAKTTGNPAYEFVDPSGVRKVTVNPLVYTYPVGYGFQTCFVYGYTDKPSYHDQIDEGAYTAAFQIHTSNIPASTVLYWNIYSAQTLSATTADTPVAADFTSAVTSGTVVVQNNYARVDFTAVADQITEGHEFFVLQVRRGSNTGPIYATSNIIKLADTSTGANQDYVEYFVGPSSVNANETFNVAVKGGVPSTPFVWSGETTGDGTLDGSGNFAFNGLSVSTGTYSWTFVFDATGHSKTYTVTALAGAAPPPPPPPAVYTPNVIWDYRGSTYLIQGTYSNHGTSGDWYSTGNGLPGVVNYNHFESQTRYALLSGTYQWTAAGSSAINVTWSSADTYGPAYATISAPYSQNSDWKIEVTYFARAHMNVTFSIIQQYLGPEVIATTTRHYNRNLGYDDDGAFYGTLGYWLYTQTVYVTATGSGINLLAKIQGVDNGDYNYPRSGGIHDYPDPIGFWKCTATQY